MAATLSKRSTCEAGPGERVALLMAADESIRYYCGGYYTTCGRIGTTNQRTQPRHRFEFVSLLSIMRCVDAGWLEAIDGANHYERRWRLTVTGRREMAAPGSAPVQLNLFNHNQTPMTATEFREAAGEIATRIAISCGYSRAYWSDACRHGRDIPPERLACMADALEAHIINMKALARTMRREVPNEETP